MVRREEEESTRAIRDDLGSPRRRGLLFAGIAVAMTAIAGAAVARAMLRRASPSHHGEARASSSAAAPIDVTTLARAPHLLFRNVELSDSGDFGKVAVTPLDPGGVPRRMTPLRCARLHFAAGQGLCLGLDETNGRKTLLRTFGADLEPRWSTELGGVPSRARVSPDGRYGAVTIFVTGHSYSDADMSTQTLIIDMAADRVEGDLEKFEVTRDGSRFEAPDFNFWGVTFARDPNRFYATLSSAGKTWLVEGDVAARKLRTMRENVECPSISPDGKRLGFKKRIGGPGSWRLHVLDLATLEDRKLAGEDRPIDDQIEWVDDGHIVYKHGADVWTLPVDGSAAARVFLPRASSPVVVRPPS